MAAAKTTSPRTPPAGTRRAGSGTARGVAIPDDESLAAMAKAIGHPARLAILRFLAHRDTCATGDVVAQLPLAQSTVSEHLRILRDAGLIQGEFEGPRTRYCVDPVGLASLRAGIAAL